MKKYYSMMTEGDTAELMVYGDITSLPFFESDVSSHNLVKEISELNVKTINVHINSYGGECSEALAIVNALNRHPAQVITYNDGFACSAAATVFMAGDRRIASKYSTFLFHNAWATITGNADELRAEADNLDTITRQSKELYLDKTALTEEELDALMKEERFLDPEEAELMGFATEIEGDDEPEEKQTVKRAIFQKFMKAEEPEEEPEEEPDEETESTEESEEPDEADDDKETPDEEPEQKLNCFSKFLKGE